MPDSTSPAVDRERDVFVTSFDMTIAFPHRRRGRAAERNLWRVFVGSELIDHFEDLDDAIELARRVSTRSRRPAWVSSDGVAFQALDQL